MAIAEMDHELKANENPGVVKDFRKDVFAFEGQLSKVPGAVHGDSEEFPLKHTFADGVYVREIFIPKGSILTGKIHRHSHPNFLMKGEVIVVTEGGGQERLKAPLSMISKAGTKRVVVALEDTVWVTVHVTDERDLEKIEDEVISKTYEELPAVAQKQIEAEFETRNCLILALKEKRRDYSSLLNIERRGYLLPFKKALHVLQEAGVSLDGLFANIQTNGEWHVTTDRGLSLDSLEVPDSDMVGSWVAVGVGGATLAGSLVGTFAGPKKKIEEPKEIKAARQVLLDFARSGKVGNFTAGEEVPMGYGDFSTTPIEGQGMTALSGLLSSGIPNQYRLGDEALASYLETDPTDVAAQYEPFKKTVERQIGESQRNLKRNAAFAGNLYSTDTIQQLGDVEARGNETLTQKLADLTDSALNRRLQAIPMTYQSGREQEAITQDRIGSAYQYGGLTRQLNDASIKARDAEILRRRQEMLLPLNSAGTVLGGPSQLDINPNPYQDLLTMVGQIGGQYLGTKLANGGQRYNNPGYVSNRSTAYNTSPDFYNA